jgi:hypothetical protein
MELETGETKSNCGLEPDAEEDVLSSNIGTEWDARSGGMLGVDEGSEDAGS